MGKQKQLLRQEIIGTSYKYVPKHLKRKVKSNKRKKQEQKHNIFDNLFYWAREIRMRDEYKCKCCGSKKYLEAHHLFYKSKYPGLKYNLGNGILLCNKCHNELHTLNDNIIINIVEDDNNKEEIINVTSTN